MKKHGWLQCKPCRCEKRAAGAQGAQWAWCGLAVNSAAQPTRRGAVLAQPSCSCWPPNGPLTLATPPVPRCVCPPPQEKFRRREPEAACFTEMARRYAYLYNGPANEPARIYGSNSTLGIVAGLAADAAAAAGAGGGGAG